MSQRSIDDQWGLLWGKWASEFDGLDGYLPPLDRFRSMVGRVRTETEAADGKLAAVMAKRRRIVARRQEIKQSLARCRRRYDHLAAIEEHIKKRLGALDGSGDFLSLNLLSFEAAGLARQS